MNKLLLSLVLIVLLSAPTITHAEQVSKEIRDHLIVIDRDNYVFKCFDEDDFHDYFVMNFSHTIFSDYSISLTESLRC